MFLFKKKKSDTKLSTNVTRQQQQQQRSVELTHPNPPKKPLPLIDQKPRQSTPPSIIMPKPRRLLTPTRAILGRYDHDKTQVEEEEEQVPDIISPILLPTLHQEQDMVIHKPVAVVPKKSALQYVHSSSTASSNNSSKLYESAQEFLSDEEDNTRFSNLSSFSLLKKQGLDSNIASDSSSRTATPGTRLHRVAVRSTTSSSATITPTRHKDMPANITLATVATTTAEDVDTATAAVAAEYINNDNNTTVSENNNPIIIHNAIMKSTPIINDSFVLNNNPVNMDSAISHNSGTTYNNVNYADDNADNNIFSTNNDITFSNYVSDDGNHSAPFRNAVYDQKSLSPNETKHNKEIRHSTKEVDDLNLSLQKQKEEQDILLHRLTKQVEMMEKQRILDREEWCRKEQELLAYRQMMMNTLDETQQKLSNVLKTREEQKEKEVYYQQQLQLQQLQQLQQSQQVEAAARQPQDNEGDNDGIFCGSECDDDNDESPTELEFYDRRPVMEEPNYNERRVIRNSKSEEYMRYHNNRSSSRTSLHRTQYYPQYPEEERRSVSRRNSNNSNKSYRLDPSPSTTIVANPMTPRGGRMSRPRARSIEATADMSQNFPRKPRRSKSVGRRPPSRGSMVYYDEATEQFDDYDMYYEDPRYNKAQPRYGNEYYMAQPPAQPPQYNYYPQFPSHAPRQQQQHGVRYVPRNYDYY